MPRGSFVQSSPGDRLSPEIHGSLFLFLANVFIWVCVSVATSLLLSRAVVASLRYVPVLPIAGELCLLLQAEERNPAAELTCTSDQYV